ncbi:unnamed protein product [Caenorhabditis brenneri]
MHLLFLLLIFLPSISYSQTTICTNGFTLVNNKCLKLFTEPATRRNASNTCGKYGGTLVTIKSTQDNSDVATIVANTKRRVWIGLYCFENASSTCLWDNELISVADYNNFAPSFPYVEIGHCVTFKTAGILTGKWLNVECGEDLRPFVCEIPFTFEDDCALNYNGHCYIPSEGEAIGFDNARRSCQAVCADLVSFHSDNEIRFVESYYESSNVSSIRIGGRTPYKIYKWVDGTEWKFVNYAHLADVADVNEECLFLALKTDGKLSKGSWYGDDCLESRNFMCKRKIGTQCDETTTAATVAPVDFQKYNTLFIAPETFTSPNYPGNYTENLTSVYRLLTVASKRIRLTFWEIDTEQDYDTVFVYDGSSQENPLIANISGKHENLYYESSGNTMYVKFTTDHTINKLGFKASFRAII